MIAAGATLTLDVEKVTAGGRMLARHQGQVVLVSGTLPGERVDARVERAGKGIAWAETIAVRSASPDRRDHHGDWRCGGTVFAHVDYQRQLGLKGEIIHDAFARIGRIPLSSPPGVAGSPETGYRMRARLHAKQGRLGFYREGSHEICDAVATRQLLPATNEWIAQAQSILQRDRLDDVLALEIAENVSGDERAGHIEVRGRSVDRYRALADGLVGLSAGREDDAHAITLAGAPVIHDDVPLSDGIGPLRLRRHARAFFQGNRFLVARLVREVTTAVRPGSVVDLYAGGGLFGLALAATGADQVTLVEGDAISGDDLVANAAAFAKQVTVERRSVESFLARGAMHGVSTVIVDPPRTGLSKDALAGVVRARVPAIVYVSCDVPTLARDARILIDAGFELSRISALDLFPNTAHVETVAVFTRASRDFPRGAN